MDDTTRDAITKLLAGDALATLAPEVIAAELDARGLLYERVEVMLYATDGGYAQVPATMFRLVTEVPGTTT